MNHLEFRAIRDALDRIEKRLATLEARPIPNYYYQGPATTLPTIWPWPVTICASPIASSSGETALKPVS